MKSERRHELEKNQLAEWLYRNYEKVQPYVNTILTVILAVLLVVLIGVWWSNRAEGQAGDAWSAYYAAIDTGRAPADFEAIGEKFPGSEAAKWATQTAADLYLESGCNMLFSSKASANQELRKAIERYLDLLGKSRIPPPLRERATFGLARAREAQCDLEKARESYEAYMKEWPNGAFVPVVKQRLVELGKQETKVFFDKFAKFDPKPPTTEDNKGKKPAFDIDSLPDNPSAVRPSEMKLDGKSSGDIQLKGPEGLSKDAKKAEKPAETKPATEAKK